MNCTSLTNITIPESVTSIGDCTFISCSDLTSINFKGTLDQWSRIKKAGNWDDETGNYTVYCTDGLIKKDGSVIFDQTNITNIIVLYRYIRPDGGTTVGPYKPTVEYTQLYRLVANDGYVLYYNGEYYGASVLDVDSLIGWTQEPA